MKTSLSIFLITLLIVACSKQQTEVKEVTAAPEKAIPEYPTLLTDALTAHGGITNWQKFGTLEYNLKKTDFSEYQLIDLNTRNTLLITDKYKLGFDGENAWVTPSKEVFGRSSIRFYHNLYFYFFAFPFVLADEGIAYEELPAETVEGITYDVLKIGYGDNIGDSPDDNYICYFDQNTKQLKFIRYTVTYFSKEQSEKYNALKYVEWQGVNGLMVPKRMDSYRWTDGTFGEQRGSTSFENVVFTEDAPPATAFQMPAGAEVDEETAQ